VTSYLWFFDTPFREDAVHKGFERLHGREVRRLSRHNVFDPPFELAFLDLALSMQLHDKGPVGW
jgi:hypothetical protein